MEATVAFTDNQLRIKFRNSWGTDSEIIDIIRKKYDDDSVRSITQTWCDWSDDIASSERRTMKHLVRARQPQAGSFRIRRTPWTVAETNVLVGLHAEAMSINQREAGAVRPTITSKIVTAS